jgi:sigma-B regulation protein RsbU (phosphoserine phosphatase)
VRNAWPENWSPKDSKKIMKTLIEPSPILSVQPLKFTLPCPLSLPPDPMPGAGKGAPPKTRILVAEDDPVSREVICARLEKWGFSVIATTNGTEAMAELRKKDAPHLAILDWMMPGLDGIEICQRVREGERMLYIILLTALGARENMVHGLNAGADDYLIKPFDKSELHARILVGLRVMALQSQLAERVKELQNATTLIGDLKRQMLV